MVSLDAELRSKDARLSSMQTEFEGKVATLEDTVLQVYLPLYPSMSLFSGPQHTMSCISYQKQVPYPHPDTQTHTHTYTHTHTCTHGSTRIMHGLA
jgi:hypothetical protein